MYTPSSTYRIQFNKDFTFHDFDDIIDYLHVLGISTIYAAPILKSTRGSAHGYDVTDPHVIDPEIGTIEELREIIAKLKRKGMTWLQDIVPNHMAFDPSNKRLMDVMERGPASEFYNYFDIQWDHPSPSLNKKLMVPFLGDSLDTCLKKNQLTLSFGKNGFEVSYFKTAYPISSVGYDILFSIFRSAAAKKLRQDWNDFIKGRAFTSGIVTWKKLKTKWINSLSAQDRSAIKEIVERVNSDTEKISKVLAAQHYVLTHWKDSEREINYRRFFTINQLICLRMEDKKVFDEYHTFLLSLYKEGLIQGLRIDHIDGLKDPTQYIKNLRDLFGDTCYIIAEKILETKEAMPADWEVQGTSGYEFLAHVSQLFTDRKGAKQLLDFYRTLVPELPDYKQLVVTNKRKMLENYMGGEWDNLASYFEALGLLGNFSKEKIREALGEMMVSMPVYRIYPEEIPLRGKELTIISEAIANAKNAAPVLVAPLDYLASLFSSSGEDGAGKDILAFLQRLMQFTGPLTAKGVEDTTFYIYNPLISHDEVGDSPSTLGITISEFHKRMVIRQQTAARSLNATATHDTKRGEDVRIRLNVLSEIPETWKSAVADWMEVNKNHTHSKSGQRLISVNDEYFIYQSIIGGFPEDRAVSEEWIKRLQEYLTKVVREAKVNSSWESPDEAYETRISKFIEGILSADSDFLKNAITFVQGMLNTAQAYTLAQTLIKITAPGIPDFYQGCEVWDLSYVDPDNRRRVDYDMRKKYLDKIRQKEKEGGSSLMCFLKENRQAGLEKIFVAWKALNFRRSSQRLFIEGEYIPLPASNGDKVAVCYARHFQDDWCLVVVPLAIARDETHDLRHKWTDEAIVLPPSMPRTWINIFTGDQIDVDNRLFLRDVLEIFPLVLLKNKKA
jgi:(1->4)-alpha-D-glucan 1-alpha-D-glucosylmutase